MEKNPDTQKIIIEVAGGVVQNVSDIPYGIIVEIHDFDNVTPEADCSIEVYEHSEERSDTNLSFSEMTLKIAKEKDLGEKFVNEVQKLLDSGIVDVNKHSRGLVFAAALSRLADAQTFDFVKVDKTFQALMRII